METYTPQSLLHTIKEDGNPEKAPIHKNYHKSELTFYGWDTPDLRKLATALAKQIKDNDTLFIYSAHLWASEIWDARMLSNFLLAKRLDLFTEEDFNRFYKWFRDCDGWAVTDMLAYPVLGEYLRRFPQFIPQVDDWKEDDYLWVRRAGLVRFITPLRHKEPWPDNMERVLRYHFNEEDFFIRKAIGWVLREWSKREPQRVLDFCERHKDEMAPLSYREAIRNIKK